MTTDDRLLFVHECIVPAVNYLLPGRMQSVESTAMLLAIGLQESKFAARAQIVRGKGKGPARGYWQFELGGGVTGVLEHALTRTPALQVLSLLSLSAVPGDVHAALEQNDILACVFARLLLYTVPGALPQAQGAEIGWKQYAWAWRPGKPRPDEWTANYAEAWRIAGGAHE